MAEPPRAVYLADELWNWLKGQPGGASATVRALVEREMAEMSLTVARIEVKEKELAVLKAQRPSERTQERLNNAWKALNDERHVRNTRVSQVGWLSGPAGRAWLRRYKVTAEEILHRWDHEELMQK